MGALDGSKLASDSHHSHSDLALFGTDDFRLLSSTKRVLRRECSGTYLHEACFCKQRRPNLQDAFVISEFNEKILCWLANDSLVGRFYCVSKAALLEAHEPFPKIAAGNAISKARLLGEAQDVKNCARWLKLRDRAFDLSPLFADIEAPRPTLAADRLAVQPTKAQGDGSETGLNETDD